MKKLFLTPTGLTNLPQTVMVPFRGKTKSNRYCVVVLPANGQWEKVEIYLSYDNSSSFDEIVLHHVDVLSTDLFRDGGTRHIKTSEGLLVIPKGLMIAEPLTFDGEVLQLF